MVKEKMQYLIVGDNNFWYASCIDTLKEAEEQIKEIKANPNHYGIDNLDDELTSLYIYKAKLVKQIDVGKKE